MEKTFLTVILVILAVLILLAFLRAVIGPKFTDRLVGINCMSTMIIVVIVILSCYLEADYLSDVALIYAMLGFTANVVLTRILLNRHNRKELEAHASEEAAAKEDTP